jgi:hypothetical protein
MLVYCAAPGESLRYHPKGACHRLSTRYFCRRRGRSGDARTQFSVSMRRVLRTKLRDCERYRSGPPVAIHTSRHIAVLFLINL